MPIKLVRGDGAWRVVGESVLAESSDLAWAAFDAVMLAKIQDTTVELGDGVPEDAIAQAREREAELEAFRPPSSSSRR